MATRSLHLPIVLDIPEPCSEDWNDMAGDERERHCARCDKQIHNLSVLTEAQIAELAFQENICVSLEARTDGTLVSADAPRDRRRGHAGRVVLTAALTALAACGSDHVVGKALPSHPVESASAEPAASTPAPPPEAANPPAVPSTALRAIATPSASTHANPPVQRLGGAPVRVDPPVVHKVGKVARVPNDF